MHPNRLSSFQSTRIAGGPRRVPFHVGERIFHSRVRPAVLWAAVLMGLAVVLLASSRAGAQATPTVGDPVIAERQFIGAASRDGVVIRSGATGSHLAVMTLADKQEVVVVNAEGDFLRILPPEGTFCLVPKARVALTDATDGGNKIGRVNEPCSVRAGSRIIDNPGETMIRLAIDAEVRVIGEDNTYYKVLPPKGVFFYVQKQDMLNVREITVTETAQGWAVGELGADPVAEATDSGTPAEGDDAVAQGQATEPPVDMEAAAPDEVPEVVVPTTQPAILAEIRDLDARYAEAAKLPLEEQPLEALKQEYAAKLAIAEADPSLASAVDALQARVNAITFRQEALQDLLALQAMREEKAKRQKVLAEEERELAERAEQARVTVYAAVGQLQPSTLQVGAGSLFRLCDPATGRTLIYLRAEGDVAKSLARNIEQFVGIKGETATDEDLDLKFIQVSEVAAVNPQHVFKSVAATIIPPSLAQNAAAGG